MNKIMEKGDKNNDGKYNFREFSLCVGFLVKCLAKKSCKGKKCDP